MDEIIRIANVEFNDAVFTISIVDGENTPILYVFNYKLNWDAIKRLEQAWTIEHITYVNHNDNPYGLDGFAIVFKMYHMPTA